MPIANFEELCKGICEMAGFACPKIAIGQRRVPAFSLRLRGVTLTAMEPDPARSGAALLIAEVGAMPAEKALTGWLALMDANMVLMDADAPRFCRNPVNGEVTLQWPCSLETLSVTEAHARVMRMVEMVGTWRHDPLLLTAGAQAGTSPPPRPCVYAQGDPAAVKAALAFRRFHKSVCDELGTPVEFIAQGTVDCKFSIRSGPMGVDVTIGHSPTARPDAVFVSVHLGVPPHGSTLDRAVELMDANFALAMEPDATIFCRAPWSGEFMLVYVHRLAATGVHAFLKRLARVVLLARAWQTAPHKISERVGVL